MASPGEGGIVPGTRGRQDHLVLPHPAQLLPQQELLLRQQEGLGLLVLGSLEEVGEEEGSYPVAGLEGGGQVPLGVHRVVAQLGTAAGGEGVDGLLLSLLADLG